MKREEEWGAEGEGENEGGETARARRNGGQTASARSQASTRSAAARCSSGDREISYADRCSERPGFKATKGEGENNMTAGSSMPTLKSAKVRIRHSADDPEGRPATAMRTRQGRYLRLRRPRRRRSVRHCAARRIIPSLV